MGDVLARALASLGLAYADDDRYRQFILPRHSRIGTLLWSGTPFQGIMVGDSICEGTGASDANHRVKYALGAKLGAKFGGSTVAWAPLNNGVGSTTIEQCLAYLGHTLDASGNTITVGPAYSKPYWVIMTGRNDQGRLSVTTFSKLYRTAVRMGMRAGIDVICCTEPPTIDMTSHQISDPNYPDFADEIRRIAALEGASLVDVHKEWLYQQQVKGVDLSTLTIDGVHPNDTGHAIIADMIYRCMTLPPIPINKRPNIQDDQRLGYYVFSQYNLASSSLTSTFVPVITTESTSRARATGTNDAILIAQGGQAEFKIPNCRVEYVIVTVINDPAAGDAKVEVPWGITIANAMSSKIAVVREYSSAFAGDQTYPSSFDVLVSAVNGPVRVTGVHVICPAISAQHDTVRGTEAPAWADVADQGSTWRSSSTVGNTITVNWYGTELSVDLGTGVDRGVLGYATDGGAKATRDGYQNASAKTARVIVAKNLARGWHSTVFSVETKNVSSSANLVNIRNLQVYAPVPDGSVTAMGGIGITVLALDGATIARSFGGGIPTVASGTTGSTVTSTVSGIIETAIK